MGAELGCGLKGRCTVRVLRDLRACSLLEPRWVEKVGREAEEVKCGELDQVLLVLIHARINAAMLVQVDQAPAGGPIIP